MPKKKATTPDPISQYLSEIGRKGGKAGTGKSKARDPEKMREAGKQSWKNRKAK